MNKDTKKEMLISNIFQFKDNYYMLLLDEKCNRFFLRIDNNTLFNVTLEEYIDINRSLFSPNPLYGHKKINIKPLIKFKKELITLGLASTIIAGLTGCGEKDYHEYLTEDVKIEKNIEEEPIVVEPKETGNLEETIQGLRNIGIRVEDISELNDMYNLSSIVLADKTSYGVVDFSQNINNPYETKCAPNKFGKYIGIENVTYDDLKNVVKQNNNIDDNIKEIINTGLDNLKEANFNMDLTTLYYNLSRLTVEYVNPEEINGAYGLFNHLDGSVKINNIVKDDPKVASEVLIHEIIGHGSTRAYDPNKRIMVDISDMYITIDEKGAITEAGCLGFSGLEAIADAITSIATQKKINVDSGGYTTEVYELITLCSSLDISLADYANSGVDLLIWKMKEKGIDNPYLIIRSMDDTSLLMMQDSLIQANQTDLFIDYYKELYEDGNDINKLKDSTDDYQEYVQTEVMGGINMVININDEDTFYYVEPDLISEYVNNLSNEKTY